MSDNAPQTANQEEIEETTAQESAQTQETEPAETTDWKAEAERWKSEARKWENRSKKNAATANKAAKSVEERVAELEAANAALREQQERSEVIDRVSTATGVDRSMVAMLNGSDEETLTEQAKKLAQAPHATAPKIPELNANAPKVPALTKKDILAIPDAKERIAAIAQHRELFE